MKNGLKLLPLLALMSATVNVHGSTIYYEGFDYGDVNTFTHAAPNASAAGGTGFSTDGWLQFNSKQNGLVSNDGSSSLAAASGYTLTPEIGHMNVSGFFVSAGNQAFTLSIRSLATPYSLSGDQDVYFSYITRNNDIAAHWADSSAVDIRRSDGTSIFNTGFDNSEQLQITSGGTTETGTSPIFTPGATMTIIGKLSMSSAGMDTLQISAYDSATDTILGEPTTWDLTTSAELSADSISQIAFFVNSGNSGVSFDELRMGNTYEDVTGVIPEQSAYGILIGFLCLVRIATRRRVKQTYIGNKEYL